MNRILDHKKRANERQGGFFPLKLVAAVPRRGRGQGAAA